MVWLIRILRELCLLFLSARCPQLSTSSQLSLLIQTATYCRRSNDQIFVTWEVARPLSNWSLIARCMGPNMGLTWGRQDPGGPHVGPMILAIWDGSSILTTAPVVPSSSNFTEKKNILLQFQIWLLYRSFGRPWQLSEIYWVQRRRSE